jgi:hypothetical protein
MLRLEHGMYFPHRTFCKQVRTYCDEEMEFENMLLYLTEKYQATSVYQNSSRPTNTPESPIPTTPESFSLPDFPERE